MDKIIEQVKENIESNNLFEIGDTIIVGVSGGPDSIFLLHALNELKKEYLFTIHVAHINHMIREEAYIDTSIARKLSDKIGAIFHLLEIDVKNEAKRLKIGTEECGRNIRYEFFDQVANAINANKIVVAHNAGDNAETIVINFLRGTGINGLSGIDMKNKNIVRPILNITKQDIINYLEKNKIEYAIDKTNNENIYTRNKIRNDLIKKIENEYNPNFINSLNRMSRINKMDSEIIEEAVEEKYNTLDIKKHENKITLDTRIFNSYSKGMKFRLVRRILTDLLGNIQGVEMVHIQDTCKLIEMNITNKQYILGNKYKVIIEKKNVAIFVKNM